MMENDGPDQSFWWYYISGDWFTLDEAAELISTELQTKKTPQDILKAGYLSYIGIDRLLPLYVPVKQARMLKLPAHVDTTHVPSHLLQNLLFAGDVFQLHPQAIERLLLFGFADSSLWPWMALGVIFSDKSVPGWAKHVDWVGKSQRWRIECDCSVEPDLQVSANDLRVDGEDLRSFIKAARKVRSTVEAGGELEEVATQMPFVESLSSDSVIESPALDDSELLGRLEKVEAQLAEDRRKKKEQTCRASEVRRMSSKAPVIKAWFLVLEQQGQNLAERELAGKIAKKFDVSEVYVRTIRTDYLNEKVGKAQRSSIGIV